MNLILSASGQLGITLDSFHILINREIFLKNFNLFFIDLKAENSFFKEKCYNKNNFQQLNYVKIILNQTVITEIQI